MADTDFSLNFVCPTCGARPQEDCVLSNGLPRLGSHVERRAIANGYQCSPALREGGPLSFSMERWPRSWKAKPSTPPAEASGPGD